MENPFKKILTTVASVSTLASTSAQETAISNPITQKTEIRTVESNSETQKLFKAASDLEQKLSSDKEIKTLPFPTIAIYSADELLKQKSLINSPLYSSTFWAELLKVKLVSEDTQHAYLERSTSSSGLGALENEKKIVDSNSGPAQKYVRPTNSLIVSVNSSTDTITVILSTQDQNSSPETISVKMNADSDAILSELFQKISEKINVVSR